MSMTRSTFNSREQTETGHREGNGAVTIGAFGRQRTVAPGRSVRETLQELGYQVEDFQYVMVNGREVPRGQDSVVLKENDQVAIGNRVAGG